METRVAVISIIVENPEATRSGKAQVKGAGFSI